MPCQSGRAVSRLPCQSPASAGPFRVCRFGFRAFEGLPEPPLPPDACTTHALGKLPSQNSRYERQLHAIRFVHLCALAWRARPRGREELQATAVTSETSGQDQSPDETKVSRDTRPGSRVLKPFAGYLCKRFKNRLSTSQLAPRLLYSHNVVVVVSCRMLGGGGDTRRVYSVRPMH